MPNEAEYLALQAARAKARFKQTARILADELMGPFEIRPLIQRRPWSSLGVAALGGFVSGLRFGGRGRPSGADGRGGRVLELVAGVRQRIQRVLSGALGAIVLANLRRGPPAAVARTSGAVDTARPSKAS